MEISVERGLHGLAHRVLHVVVYKREASKGTPVTAGLATGRGESVGKGGEGWLIGWRSVVWCGGEELRGVVWCGEVWSGVVWHGEVLWNSVKCGMVWRGVAW